MAKKNKTKEMINKMVEAGYSLEETVNMDGEKVQAVIDDLEKASSLMETVVISEDTVPMIPNDVAIAEEKPLMSDRGWTKYVMSLFDESELDNGMPRVDGLRRVAESVMGPFSSTTDLKQVPTLENGYRATAVVTLDFKYGVRYSGAADVFSGNCDRTFALHPVATAETRAEGRALRKALKLSKIISAEELSKAETDEPNGLDQRITSSMLNSLRVMTDRMGVDLFKLSLKQGYNIVTVEDLTPKQGLEISNVLGKFNRGEEQVSEEVKK